MWGKEVTVKIAVCLPSLRGMRQREFDGFLGSLFEGSDRIVVPVVNTGGLMLSSLVSQKAPLILRIASLDIRKNWSREYVNTLLKSAEKADSISVWTTRVTMDELLRLCAVPPKSISNYGRLLVDYYRLAIRTTDSCWVVHPHEQSRQAEMYKGLVRYAKSLGKPVQEV